MIASRGYQFDSDNCRVSIWDMKAMIAFMLLSLVALGARAQEQQSKGSASSGDRFDSPVNQRLLKEVLKEMETRNGSAKPSVTVGRHLRIEGPVVKIFKGAKIWDVPRRFLQVVNPFAPSESSEAMPRSRDLNPNAWGSSVGWQHDGIKLVSVSWQ